MDTATAGRSTQPYMRARREDSIFGHVLIEQHVCMRSTSISSTNLASLADGRSGGRKQGPNEVLDAHNMLPSFVSVYIAWRGRFDCSEETGLADNPPESLQFGTEAIRQLCELRCCCFERTGFSLCTLSAKTRCRCSSFDNFCDGRASTFSGKLLSQSVERK